MENEIEIGPVPPDIEIPPQQPTSTEPAQADKDLKKKSPPAGNAIAIRAGGSALAPSDHVQLLAFIDRLIEARAVPKHLENRLQVLAAWNFAAQLKLPPQPSLRNIAVIEGVPSLFGDLPLSLAQAHKDFVFYREYLIDPEYNEISVKNKNLSAELYAGVVEIQRRGMKGPETYYFTREEALVAGLIYLNPATKTYMAKKRNGDWSPFSPWSRYQGTMYIRRARGKGLKAHFADALCGAGIAEYDFGQAPDLDDLRDVSESKASPELGNRIDEMD